jgi:hypothetical protein
MITEKPNVRSENIDRKSTVEILEIMNEEDKKCTISCWKKK